MIRLVQQQTKQTQLGSSRWNRRNWGAFGSGHARLVLARDTTAQGCWCIRVEGYTRLAMKEVSQHKFTYVWCETVCANTNGGVVLLRPMHHEESWEYWTTHTGEQRGSNWRFMDEWGRVDVCGSVGWGICLFSCTCVCPGGPHKILL